ncbi:MAG: ABC transporter ATP-binding protein [Acetobacteraceae bacterium]|nr:ABC transporter ATP-binding protein [Acetobacteraceae bacterium]MCX7686064.1 ABC transporter ATP-binding protein [Acetobacteraceae bacterium]MDW8397905.1 ABC transporter ATP-binding protein [Acetobacteraceae bacterium]
MSAPVLEVERLVAGYGGAVAVDGASLSVGAGELLAVIGANGAGKTTLIRAIAGMVRPMSGRIRHRGEDITGWTSDRVCERGIAQVAEGRQVFPSLSVLENLRTGALLRRSRAREAANLERVMALFPRLAERRAQAAGTLSGGEQQMLAIARCLMAEPELILFDEPSLGLAPAMVEMVFGVVRRLHAEGMAMILVEQNVRDSLEICDRAIVLEGGAVVAEGSGAELLASDRVRAAYLGL